MNQEGPRPQAETPQAGAPRTEEYRLSGDDIMEKVKQLVHEGNVRRIIVKNDQGDTIAEFPLTVGVVGALLAPPLAAIGAIVALASDLTLVVERRD